MQTLTIPARFNGPPDSGNGGYVSGVVAGLASGPVFVELRSPPPLDTPLAVNGDGDELEVTDGEVLVARTAPAAPLQPPVVPEIDLDQARAAVAGYVGFRSHAFPTCFVCGPQRPDHDGLEIYPGKVAGTHVVAAPWLPSPTLADENGTVSAAFVWAALDCPSYFGCASGKVAVLARMQAELTAPVPAGRELIAIAWGTGSDGRKLNAASAILDQDGTVLAHSESLWIELRGQ